ncbi:HAS-barrel domain-containing protein [Candidatus Chloroploca sp. Khr17]|uniref:HAS-barrel domain-containing protein n=1 Tax=Candidatus Chloroploca sp. Khr17 TaxID=2496869 RepID=UPI00101C9E81|nr:HAS-barrel domain-containing protein [Candidatus Chloroploca sp. Khr17]
MQRIGEVIEASTTRFTAGAYELLEAPSFGVLVRAVTRDPSLDVYGLVYEIRTSSKDPGGRALVRGRTYSGRELFDEEIYAEHPDLAEVLQTEFSALTVGYVADGQICHYLPPQPPPVHYSVYAATSAEMVRFSEVTSFFRGVLFAAQIPGDELLAASIRGFARVRPDGEPYLLRAGREVAGLLKDDYDRLTALLRRIRP